MISRTTTGIETIYRLLLHLCPADFRTQFGVDMIELLRDRWREGPTQAGALEKLLLGRRILADLLSTATILRLEELVDWGKKLLRLGSSAPGQHPSRTPGPERQGFWTGLQQDLRSAQRSLTRNPVTTLIILLTLALGIAVNAAVFGVVDRILISPPPHILDAQDVVRVQFEWNEPSGRSFVSDTTSYPAFRLLQESGAFHHVAAENYEEMAFQRPRGTIRAMVTKVSGNYFDLLGTVPFRGGFWGSGSANDPVAVVSHSFWKSELGGDEDVVGSTFRLNGDLFTILGVAPPGFSGAQANAVDLWTPIMAGMRSRPLGWHLNPRLRVVTLVARLNPDRQPESSTEQATQALISRGLGPSQVDSKVIVTPILPGRSAGAASPLGRLAFWLAGVSGIVLLVALTNIVGLELLRSLKMRRETALKPALGISRYRLIRELLVETLILTTLGAFVGLIIVLGTGSNFADFLVPGLAPAQGVLDSRAILLCALVAFAAGSASALIRYFQATQPRSLADLRAGGAPGGYRRPWLQSSLLVAQVALALTLVIGAGLFLQSLQLIVNQDLGLDIDNVYVLNLKFSPDVSKGAMNQAYRDLESDLRQLPEVETAAHVVSLQFGPYLTVNVDVPDNPDPNLFADQFPFLYPASEGYFDVPGLKFLKGRSFYAVDSRGSERTAVVNQSFAQHAWPQQDPIGKCLRIGLDLADPSSVPVDAPCRRVVGIVNDSRIRRVRLNLDPTVCQYYIPFPQLDFLPSPMQPEIWGLVVRAEGQQGGLESKLLHETLSRTPAALFAEIQPYQDLIDPQIRPVRLGSGLFTLFGTLALGLASLGLFGAISYAVSQRRREMGIRIALGAQLRDILHLIIVDGLRVVSLGALAGLALTAYAVPWISSHLYQTSPQSPLVLGLSIGVLFLAATLASLFPALRAGHTNPNQTLRTE